MVYGKPWSLSCLLPALLALCACANPAARGVMFENESTYIGSVEVVEYDSSAPAVFADTLRDTARPAVQSP